MIVRRRTTWLLFLAWAGWASMACSARAQDASELAPSAEQITFFEKEIRPLLAEHCWKCHGEPKQEANLRLDSRGALLAGGDTGPVAISGNASASLLNEVVSYDADTKMPPRGKLSTREIAALSRWVDEGLPWPNSPEPPPAASKDPTNHEPVWSFQPITHPPSPIIRDAAWPDHPIDQFILAKLEESSFAPAPRADRRTLLRRITFDLTGIPPSPSEAEAYMADSRADADARLVDRLLAAPAYGQRWGRHWLDVARYADSNGLDENLAYVNAYRYRDYVIAAFNGDKPYDDFIREQIAGDLLEKSSDESTNLERVIATGFLSLGAKMLAEDDPVKMEMDIIDEQVDATGATFLGLTLACARCHDHKFDPISMADYYALAGIFKSTHTMENFKVVAQWHESTVAGKTEFDKFEEHRLQLERAKADLSQQREKFHAAVAARERDRRDDHLTTNDPEGNLLSPVPDYLGFSPEEQSEIDRLASTVSQLEKSAPPPLSTAMAVKEGKVMDLPIHLRGSHLHLGAVVPRGFPAQLSKTQVSLPADRSGRLELADWLTSPENPLVARVLVNRLWRWHFGQGLVRSTDNFGRLGEAPSHPELLDTLASQLRDHDFSIKSMHRDIVLSATYRMSTQSDASIVTQDPDNQLLSHFPRKRLEAEAIRDSLLHVAGRLDDSLGGRTLEANPREYVTGTASVNKTNYAINRRSVYLPVVRSALYEMFQAFDFAEPSTSKGSRETTTIAPQSLFMMNSDLMHEVTGDITTELLALDSDDQRFQNLFRRAYSRSPSPEEIEQFSLFIVRYDETLKARTPEMPNADRQRQNWQAVVRVVISSSEFIYLD